MAVYLGCKEVVEMRWEESSVAGQHDPVGSDACALTMSDKCRGGRESAVVGCRPVVLTVVEDVKIAWALTPEWCFWWWDVADGQ